jgi:steroid delta-isomerase-like uncharacterized protein
MNELKAISRSWFEEGYGSGDISVMEALMPIEMLLEASLREQIMAYRTAFPDLAVTIEEQLREGDRVMTRLTFTGHHTGDLLGVPPTGKPIELTMVELHTIRDGKIVETWNDFHPIRILQQLGLIAANE